MKDTSANSHSVPYRSHLGGTLMYITGADGDEFFSVAVLKDQVTIAWKLGSEHGRAQRLQKDHADGEWTALSIQIKEGLLEAHFQHDEWSEEAQTQGAHQFSEPDFPTEALYQLVATGRIILGAGPPISIASSSSLGMMCCNMLLSAHVLQFSLSGIV